MGFGNARRFDPAKETVGGKTDDDSVLDELTPEELACCPGPEWEALPPIWELRKMTFDHLHALFAMFKAADEKGCGLDEESFLEVFGPALASATHVDEVFQQLAVEDSVKFADFVNYLLQHVQVDRTHPTVFRTEGVKLAGDDDTPLRSRIARPVGLPPISEMGKMGLVHLRALLSEFNSNDGGEGLELDEFVRVMSEVLPGMSQEALEAQFMKVDANSDGSVSWDEFSNFILAAGAAADAQSSKQEGGALLEGPEPDLNRDVMHSAPMTHMCCHQDAERYISLALEEKGSVTRPAMTTVRMWSSKVVAASFPASVPAFLPLSLYLCLSLSGPPSRMCGCAQTYADVVHARAHIHAPRQSAAESTKRQRPNCQESARTSCQFACLPGRRRGGGPTCTCWPFRRWMAACASSTSRSCR